MVATRLWLNESSKFGSAVEGTRSCQHFEPQSVTIISVKQLNAEKKYSITHLFTASDSDSGTF